MIEYINLLKEDVVFLMLSSLWLGYFIVLGLGNTIARIGAIVLCRPYLQNALGRILDLLFYSLTVFITIKYII